MIKYMYVIGKKSVRRNCARKERWNEKNNEGLLESGGCNRENNVGKETHSP